MIIADHHALNEQGGLERAWSACEELHFLVFDVHEGIRTTLALGKKPRPPVDVEGAGAAPGHDAGLMPRHGDGIQHSFEMTQLLAVYACSVGRTSNVLHLARIGLEACESQGARGLHAVDEGEYPANFGHAGASH